MTIRLNVIDRDGKQHQIEAREIDTLMEALREHDWGVAAVCGGMCSCATCHVYIDAPWLAQLPDQQGDEREILAELSDRRATSRLSCQIPLSPELNGMRLTLAPEE